MRDLRTLGGTYSSATGINTSGQVVGESRLSGDAATHAFLYDGTDMRDLRTLGGTRSSAYGINASGQVVGLSFISGDTAQRAFLYDGTAMRDLDTLPEVVAAGWQSLGEGKLAINDSGQIVGTGLIGNQARAFRLHPQATSRYMQTIDPSTLFNLGCSQTNQNGVVILAFGGPRFNGIEYGTTLFSDPVAFTASIAGIETSVQAFLDGYHSCAGNGMVTVAVGTSNSGSRTQVTAEHGLAWGEMIARLNDYISTSNYTDRLSVAGASDIELEFSPPDTARAWVDGYRSASPTIGFFNYGDAAGCPPRAGCTGGWTPDWTQEDIFYVSWGNPPQC
jgi:probable HAF family extracellular repeat protein